MQCFLSYLMGLSTGAALAFAVSMLLAVLILVLRHKQ